MRLLELGAVILGLAVLARIAARFDLPTVAYVNLTVVGGSVVTKVLARRVDLGSLTRRRVTGTVKRIRPPR